MQTWLKGRCSLGGFEPRGLRFARPLGSNRRNHPLLTSVRRRMGWGGFEPPERRSLSLVVPCFKSAQQTNLRLTVLFGAKLVGWGGFEPQEDSLRSSSKVQIHVPTQTPLAPLFVRRSRRQKWVGADLNRRPPPCQGGVITNLDHQPSSIVASSRSLQAQLKVSKRRHGSFEGGVHWCRFTVWASLWSLVFLH